MKGPESPQPSRNAAERYVPSGDAVEEVEETNDGRNLPSFSMRSRVLALASGYLALMLLFAWFSSPTLVAMLSPQENQKLGERWIGRVKIVNGSEGFLAAWAKSYIPLDEVYIRTATWVPEYGWSSGGGSATIDGQWITGSLPKSVSGVFFFVASPKGNQDKRWIVSPLYAFSRLGVGFPLPFEERQYVENESGRQLLEMNATFPKRAGVTTARFLSILWYPERPWSYMPDMYLDYMDDLGSGKFCGTARLGDDCFLEYCALGIASHGGILLSDVRQLYAGLAVKGVVDLERSQPSLEEVPVLLCPRAVILDRINTVLLLLVFPTLIWLWRLGRQESLSERHPFVLSLRRRGFTGLLIHGIGASVMWSILASLGLAILLFALRLMGAHYAWVELSPGPFTGSIIGLLVTVQVYLELAFETSSELVLRVLRGLAGLR